MRWNLSIGLSAAERDGCRKERRHGSAFRSRHGQRARNRQRARRCFCSIRCCRTARASTRSCRSLSKSFRVIVPELPGFGGSQAVGGGLADVADRMAEAVKDAAGGQAAIVLGNGYGGFVALQMAIRHPGIAARLVLADCGAAFSEPGRDAFRNMAAASKAKGLAAITDVAMRRLFAPEFQAQHPDLMADRRAAFLRTDPDVFRAACAAACRARSAGRAAQGKSAGTGAGRRARRGDAAADVA